MSISDGQKVDALNSNAAWMSRTSDTNTLGKVDLENPQPESGNSITNVQRELNSTNSYTGKPLNSAIDVKPTWNDNTSGTPTDSLKDRADSLTTEVNTNRNNILANELDINDLRLTTGTADGDVDMGTYTPGTNFSITDNQTTKQNIQEVATQVDVNRGDIDTNAANISSNDTDILNLQNDKQDVSDKGQPNGYASLDGSGLVPASQLPSFVDDVLEFADLASFPATGETGKIYVALDTNKTYRWSGSVYIEVSSSDVTTVNGQTGAVVLDADDIDDAATTNKWATQAEKDKLSNITVTQAVDLDTLESDVATNNAKVSADGSINTHSDVDTITTPPVIDDVLKWDGSNWIPGVGGSGSGSGVGGINYLEGDSFNFETGTVGDWTQYIDSANAIPDDGVGGGLVPEIAQIDSTLTSPSSSFFISGNTQVAQKFLITSDFETQKIVVKGFFNNTAATGNLYLDICSQNLNFEPDTSNIIDTSNPVDVTTIGSTPQDVEFTFSALFHLFR